MKLRVLRPGALTTVQDLGRPGRGRFGVTPSGAMDCVALRVANALAGNDAGAAALEVTGPGLEVEVEDDDGWFALAGADLLARLDGAPLPAFGTWGAVRGQRLVFGGRARGARAYLAPAGGIEVPLALGSAATDLDAGLGGWDGRPLRRGQLVASGRPERVPSPVSDELLDRVRRWYDDDAVAVIPSGEAGGALGEREWRVGERASRTGYRLEGAPLDVPRAGEAVSEPIAPGAVQVAADGRPILLMADRPTVGGYPVVAHVVRAHLPRAAQLWPGDIVRFVAIDLAEAWRLAREQEDDVAAVERMAHRG